MDLVEVFRRDFVDNVFGSVIVSRAEVIGMEIMVLRSDVRRAQELVAAARLIGDADALAEAAKNLKDFRMALALALVTQARLGGGRAVPKADEPKGKPAKLP